MRENTKKTGFETPVTLLAVLLFAFCVLSVILAGAGVYKRVTAADSLCYADRTAEQYIRTRLRTAQTPAAVFLTETEGQSVLCLPEELDGVGYVTCLYLYNGYMREVFLPAGEDGAAPQFAPSGGDRLLELEELRFEEDGGLLKITLRVPEGETRSFYISLREGSV